MHAYKHSRIDVRMCGQLNRGNGSVDTNFTRTTATHYHPPYTHIHIIEVPTNFYAPNFAEFLHAHTLMSARSKRREMLAPEQEVPGHGVRRPDFALLG